MEDRIFVNKLNHAILKGDITIAKRLIKGGVNVNSTFWYDGNLLHEAVVTGKIEIVKLLLDAGAPINNGNKNGDTALHMSCRRNNTELVKYLLEQKADVNARTLSEKTPLHIALWRENVDVAKMLISNGASVNHPDHDDWTPLHWAVRGKRTESLIQELLERGARINSQDKQGMTSLHVGISYSNPGSIVILLQNGADTSLLQKNLNTLLPRGKKFNEDFLKSTARLLSDCGLQLPDHLMKLAAKSSIQACKECLNTNQNLGNEAKIKEMISSGSGIQESTSRSCSCQNTLVTGLQTLSSFTRMHIRKHLNEVHGGRAIKKYIQTLALPKVLKDFLIFNEESTNFQNSLFQT